MKRQRLAVAAARGIGRPWGMGLGLGLGLAMGWASAQDPTPAVVPALPATPPAAAAAPAAGASAAADGRPAVKLPELRDLGLSVPRQIKAASALVGMGRQRLALVVGMGTVGSRQVVDNASRDAKAVAAALREDGFVVMLREDISGADLRAALKEFHDRLQPGGLGFAYFSGLGAQVGGQNLLLPRDAVLDAQAPVAERLIQLGKAGVPLSEVVDALMGPVGSPRLLVVDAAYRHPALDGLPAPGLQAQKLPPGVMALYGLALGQQQEVPAVAPLASPPPSDAREIAASAFTRTLVGEMLASRKTAPEVLRSTRRKLFDGSLGQNDPWVAGDTDSEELAEATIIDGVIPRTPEELAREAASQALRALTHHASAAATSTGTATASATSLAATAGEQSVASVLEQAPKPPVRPDPGDAGQVARPTSAKGLPADGSSAAAEPPAAPAAPPSPSVAPPAPDAPTLPATPATSALPSVGSALGTAASVAGAAVSAAGTVASVATTAATVAAVAKATEAAATVSVATTAVGAATTVAGQVAALASRLLSSPSGEAPAAVSPNPMGSASTATVASKAAPVATAAAPARATAAAATATPIAASIAPPAAPAMPAPLPSPVAAVLPAAAPGTGAAANALRAASAVSELPSTGTGPATPVASASPAAELPVQAVNDAATQAAAAAQASRAAAARQLAAAQPANPSSLAAKGPQPPGSDPRTVKNADGGERPAYNPRRNANGYAEGDTYTYQVSDAWKGEVTGRYTTAIEEVLDNGQMLADGHQTVMDAMGRLKQQLNADGSVSRFEPAQELWWSNPQRGQSRALKFTETVQRGERQSQIEWKGSTSVGSPRKIETPAGEFEALPIESSGWSYEQVAGGLNSTKWTRTVWYSPKLGHPVAIDIEDADRVGKLLKRERVELLHAQSARTTP